VQVDTFMLAMTNKVLEQMRAGGYVRGRQHGWVGWVGLGCLGWLGEPVIPLVRAR